MTTSPPFAGLTPDCLLNALEGLGLPVNGQLLALNSYENRVYQVGLDDAPPLVAKFYRPERWSDAQILEEHAFVAELADHEIPVVGALSIAGRTLHQHAGFRFALFPRRGGRAPELDRPDTLQWLGRFLGRIHAIGAVTPFALRPTLDAASFGAEPLAFLADCPFIPDELRAVYLGVARQALDGVARGYDRAGAITLRRLHGDCHAGNVLWTEAGPHFVDFDDCRMGPAVQDLWMLLSGERSEQSAQLADLLAGYEDFCEFDTRELYLVEALRTLRLIHYSAWLARRWHDPAFPAAFPWFDSPRYWQDQILALREQIALMDEAPLWPV
nr:serine/threonine protein kinase [uncultured Pseudogulbenkiania sp.]